MSGKLSTKDIKTGGGGNIPKIILPGNVTCKINSIELEEYKYIPGGYHLILNLETKPIPDFEGFLVNKDDPQGPRYKGQVGQVKASEWAFADGETKSGVLINRDTEILKFMKTLCMALGEVKWLVDQDEKHETIESLILAFNKEKPFKNIFLDFCICGKEYLSKQNYTNYELFLPKYSKEGGAPFILTDGGTGKVIVFNPAEHIRKKKTTSDSVQEFGERESTELDTGSKSEFEL